MSASHSCMSLRHTHRTTSAEGLAKLSVSTVTAGDLGVLIASQYRATPRGAVSRPYQNECATSITQSRILDILYRCLCLCLCVGERESERECVCVCVCVCV